MIWTISGLLQITSLQLNPVGDTEVMGDTDLKTADLFKHLLLAKKEGS